MKLKNIIFFLALSIFSLKAQQEEPKPPKFTISFSKPTAKIGDVIEVILKANIPEGIHMYSTYNKCEIGPIKLDVQFKENGSYSLQGEPYSIGDKRVLDEIFKCEIGEFFGKAEVRQKIKILTNEVKVESSVEGQWCTESACYPFGGKQAPIKLQGTLKATGTAIAEQPTEQPIPTKDSTELKTLEDTSKQIISPSGAQIGEGNGYKLSGPNDNAPCVEKTFNGLLAQNEQSNFWTLFIIAFLSGLAALLTPCVFPMIPMTISYFMKDGISKKKSVINGIFFGLSIIFIYVVLGVIVSALFGPKAGNFLATHWIPNILFFFIFLFFAFSFFGAFEITLPSWMANKVDKEADKGGLYGTFFMALTLAIVSFSCTGPIVSTVLINSANGQFAGPIVAMLGFGLSFALPFSIFAIFPGLLSNLPKSGGWLNAVKVVFGFVELALAFKFLSIIDQTYHWHILDREVFLSLWIVIFGLMGIYLLGKLKFSHDSDLKFISVPRLLFAVATLSFVTYLIPGLWGAPLKALAGYLPPMSTQDFDITRTIRESSGLKGNVCKKPSYSDKLHHPLSLNGYFDYDEAVACSKELKKPILLDFTGHGCVNCRKMEEKVWSNPKVYQMIADNYILASLYVDDKQIPLPPNEHFIGRYSREEITMLGEKNTEIQLCYFNKNAQPWYCLIDHNENLLQLPVGSEINNKQFDVEEFYLFLENGLKEYQRRLALK